MLIKYDKLKITPVSHAVLGEVKSLGTCNHGTVLVNTHNEIVLIDGNITTFQSDIKKEVLEDIKVRFEL